LTKCPLQGYYHRNMINPENRYLTAFSDYLIAQELLGHADVKTTMIYTHVANRSVLGVKSPFDDL